MPASFATDLPSDERRGLAAVIYVHLNGSFFVSRAAAEHFRKQESGAFVHITCTSGLIGNVGQANYAAAKLGIAALSKSIALDMKRYNVRSNCLVALGLEPHDQFDSGDHAGAAGPLVEKLQRMTPDKNAPLAVFLASDAARTQRPGVRNTHERDLPVQLTAPDPYRASGRWLDAGDDSGACAFRRCRRHSCRSIRQNRRFPGIRSDHILEHYSENLTRCRPPAMVGQSMLGGEQSMSGDDRPRSIAEMPAQRPADPATPAEARGRFFNTGNGFNVQLPPVSRPAFSPRNRPSRSTRRHRPA